MVNTSCSSDFPPADSAIPLFLGSFERVHVRYCHKIRASLCPCHTGIRGQPVLSPALTVDIDRPDSSDVSLVCAKALSIVREPGIDDVILGHREEQIALTVVFDLRQ